MRWKINLIFRIRIIRRRRTRVWISSSSWSR